MEKQTLIDLINRVLLGIGEAPLADSTEVGLIQLGTDVDVAKRSINKTMREVLSQGWFFNMDYDYRLIPDTDGFITVPPNVLRVDFGATEFKYRYSLRNGKIYDNINHTFVIGKSLIADLVYLVDVEELPVEAYEYVADRASRKFQEVVIGAVDLNSVLYRSEQESLVNLQRVQLQSQDYSLIRGSRIHSGYLRKYLYKNKGRRS